EVLAHHPTARHLLHVVADARGTRGFLRWNPLLNPCGDAGIGVQTSRDRGGRRGQACRAADGFMKIERIHGNRSRTFVCGLLLGSAGAVFSLAWNQSATDRYENFDKDPGWEGRNNRPTAAQAREVWQDFGYSRTN